MRHAFLSVFMLLVIVGTPMITLAQGGGNTPIPGGSTPGNSISLPNPLGTTATAKTLIDRIIDWLLALGAPVAAIMIIYGAFQMLFAGGSPENFTKGKNTILYAAVGYGIIFIGWGLVSIVEKLLTTNP